MNSVSLEDEKPLKVELHFIHPSTPGVHSMVLVDNKLFKCLSYKLDLLNIAYNLKSKFVIGQHSCNLLKYANTKDNKVKASENLSLWNK